MRTKHLGLLLVSLLGIVQLYGQCTGFPATVAEPTCGVGTTLTNGANINSGTYTFCATGSSTTTFGSENISGGTLTVCGNLNITSLSFNSGTIVVACGATLTLGSVTLNNNTKIVNYGRVNINGTLNFQNSNNCFYNEGTTSRLYVTGSITFPQNVGQTAYLKNNGYISIGGTFDARNGGFSCFGDQSSLEATNLNYGNNCSAPANSFTYSSGTGTAIVRYTGGATLYASFTSSTHYAINKGTTATQTIACAGAGWGSAVVATNAPAIVIPAPAVCLVANCFSILPVGLSAFEIAAGEAHIDAYWSTESEQDNAYFLLERSANGSEWEAIANVPGSGNSASPLTYTYRDEAPLRGISYYRLVQTDFDGKQTISDIRSAVMRPESSFLVYPNPAQELCYLLTPENSAIGQLVLVDASGRTVYEKTDLPDGLEVIPVDQLPRGVYVVAVTFSNGTTERQRLVVE